MVEGSGHVDGSCSITMLFSSDTVPSTTVSACSIMLCLHVPSCCVCMFHHAASQVELRLQKQSAIQWESLESTSSVSTKLVHKMALLENAGKLACNLYSVHVPPICHMYCLTLQCVALVLCDVLCMCVSVCNIVTSCILNLWTS